MHLVQLPDALKPDDQTSTSAPQDKPSAFKLRNPVSRSSKYAALCLKFQICKCIIESITLAVLIHPVRQVIVLDAAHIRCSVDDYMPLMLSRCTCNCLLTLADKLCR